MACLTNQVQLAGAQNDVVCEREHLFYLTTHDYVVHNTLPELVNSCWRRTGRCTKKSPQVFAQFCTYLRLNNCLFLCYILFISRSPPPRTIFYSMVCSSRRCNHKGHLCQNIPEPLLLRQLNSYTTSGNSNEMVSGVEVENSSDVGSCFHIGDIVTRGTLNSEDDDDEEANVQDRRTASDSNSNQIAVAGFEGTGEERRCVLVGDIVKSEGTSDSVDEDAEEATTEHLRTAPNKSQMVSVENTGEVGGCSHIGDIVKSEGTSDSVDEDAEEATTEHLRTAPNNSNQMVSVENTGEVGSCSHIGDIVFIGRTLDSKGDSVASLTATVAPLATNNSSNSNKKWIAIIASISAASLAIAIGAIIAGLRSKQEPSFQVSTHESEKEFPWWACLTKESCFEEAKVLGYTDENIQIEDYPSNQMYGCFKNEGIIYWGMGGTDEQNSSTELAGTSERLWCYDVNLLQVHRHPQPLPDHQGERIYLNCRYLLHYFSSNTLISFLSLK